LCEVEFHIILAKVKNSFCILTFCDKVFCQKLHPEGLNLAIYYQSIFLIEFINLNRDLSYILTSRETHSRDHRGRIDVGRKQI
jgi:hypothetical protein